MPARDVTDYHYLTASGVTPEQSTRAVRAVASSATDAAECARLLDMLGLAASDGRPSVPEQRRSPAEVPVVG
jgi:hypothetical protein